MFSNILVILRWKTSFKDQLAEFFYMETIFFLLKSISLSATVWTIFSERSVAYGDLRMPDIFLFEEQYA